MNEYRIIASVCTDNQYQIASMICSHYSAEGVLNSDTLSSSSIIKEVLFSTLHLF